MTEKHLRKRIYAYLIDVLIVSIIASICSHFIFDKKEFFLTNTLRINYWNLLYYLCMFAYFVFFDFIKQGDTIGKSMLSITVVNHDYSPTNLKKRLYRSLLKFLSILFFPVAVMAYFFGNHYILQDELPKTITIKEE